MGVGTIDMLWVWAENNGLRDSSCWHFQFGLRTTIKTRIVLCQDFLLGLAAWQCLETFRVQKSLQSSLTFCKVKA